MDPILIHGECIATMNLATPESVDAIVCDPPYGLGFMGRKWDALPPGEEWAKACLRVLKPGGYILAFGGTRTYHRLTVALEDAGFEIRDCLAWMYGTGFPKSLDVSKAIDKAAGAEREILSERRTGWNGTLGGKAALGGLGNAEDVRTITAPATPIRWQGFGTALKPAFEPIVMGRKPLAKGNTVAANILEHGVGGINVDGCRIGHGADVDLSAQQNQHADSAGMNGLGESGYKADHSQPTYNGGGRFPANVLLDEAAAALLDEQSGVLAAGNRPKVRNSSTFNANTQKQVANPGRTDSGGASRFFYCAKASTRERNAGLDAFEEKTADPYGQHRGRRMEDNNVRFDGKPAKTGRNTHPTVKPIDVMRWLVRLVTPPNGRVLDPFMGSGTTGIAATLEGFDFVGIENEAEYVEMARARIEHHRNALTQES